MNGFTLFIADAAHTFGGNKGVIERAFNRAINATADLLHLSDVDVICVDDPRQVIPETRMSGFTPNRHLVYLYVDASKKLDEHELYATLCHEFAHVKRYDGPGYGKTLFDSIIFEGLAAAFEEEMSPETGTFLSNYLKEKDDALLLEKVKNNFDDMTFDHFYWFIGESSDLPRWTGYQVGYYLVNEYMKKTHKKASELLLEEPTTFRV